MQKKIFLSLLVYVCCYNVGYTQQVASVKKDTATVVRLYFRFDRALLEKEYMTNAEALALLDATLNSSEVKENLDSIVIVASASPEGVLEHNVKLARSRAVAARDYIYWKHAHVDRDKVRIHSVGEDWSGLAKLVAEDGECPYRSRVLEIIKQDVNPATKEWRLKQVGKGAAWQYITKHYLRYLRAGATCVILFRKATPEPRPEPQPESELILDPEPKSELPREPEPFIEMPSCIREPRFAVKTNLLFDVATLLNVEVEVPIGNRWSVAGEWMFPWWRGRKSDLTMQLLTGHGEVKYWLGNRAKRDVMTGWSLGLYGGGGKYDFQIFNDDGAQGKFFDAGLSANFARKISRDLRMEYSLGIGYMQSDYESYSYARDTRHGNIKVVHYPWETRRLNWFGPTRAKVSLVWLLHYERKEAVK